MPAAQERLQVCRRGDWGGLRLLLLSSSRVKDVALAVACELGGYGGEGIPCDHISIVIKPCQSYHAFLSSRRTCMYSFSSLIPDK